APVTGAANMFPEDISPARGVSKFPNVRFAVRRTGLTSAKRVSGPSFFAVTAERPDNPISPTAQTRTVAPTLGRWKIRNTGRPCGACSTIVFAGAIASSKLLLILFDVIVRLELRHFCQNAS